MMTAARSEMRLNRVCTGPVLGDVTQAIASPSPGSRQRSCAPLPALPHRPRAYLAKKLIEVNENEALWFALDPHSIRSESVVLESSVPKTYASPHGDVTVLRDEPSRTVLETRSDQRTLLVLNDAYAPGWTVSVDGQAAEILPANYMARGVWVEAGTHRAVFEYHTPLLREGWGIFMLFAVAIGIWSFVRRRSSSRGAAQESY